MTSTTPTTPSRRDPAVLWRRASRSEDIGADEPRTTAQQSRERTYRRLLALADVVAVAFAMASLVVLTPRGPTLAALLIAPSMVVLAKATGLYDRDELLVRRSTLDEVPRLFDVVTLASFGMWLGQGVFFDGIIAPRNIALVWVVLIGAMVLLRWTAREVAARVSAADRCLFIGDPRMLERLRGKIEHAGRIELLASVPLEDVVVDLSRLRRLAIERDAHRLIIAPPNDGEHEDTLNLIREAKSTGLRVSLMPGILEVVGSSVAFDELGGMTLLGVKRFGLSRSSKMLKRSFDLIGAGVVLVVLTPVILPIALAIKLTSKGPVFFVQTRVGRDGKEFPILKFRSMYDGADALRGELGNLNEATDGLFKIANDPRVTSVGRVLRRTSLDELPQLLNVVRGEMSLVGPRPLIADEDVHVTGHHRNRLTLTPGMTGPWQVAGSARVPLSEMVKMDYLYVASWSLWNDVKICARTCRYVVSFRGQ